MLMENFVCPQYRTIQFQFAYDEKNRYGEQFLHRDIVFKKIIKISADSILYALCFLIGNVHKHLSSHTYIHI